jgi:two-component system chemotaxis response regulator CheY
VRKTALIVDDSKAMRQLVAFTLGGAGFEIIEGVDGQDGLDKLNALPHLSLIVTDVNMPTMDGLTFVKRVRALPAYKFTPLLVLTTESDDEKKKEGRAAGATGWIVKPFNPEQMLKTVAKVVP